MAHFVKVLPYKTFRIHPAAAPPYNADFDGDEMNIHVPQTEEARAEAKILLDVKNNLISPKNNTNLIGCIADSITGNYLIGLKEFTREYEKIFFDDLEELNILKPTYVMRATESIPDMIKLIEKLLGKKYAYKSNDGIYFDIAKSKNYGKLAQLEKQKSSKNFYLCNNYLNINNFLCKNR